MLEKRFAVFAPICLGLVALTASMWIAWRPLMTLTDETEPTSQAATRDAARYIRPEVGAAQYDVRSDTGTGPTSTSPPSLAEEHGRLIAALNRRVASLEKALRQNAQMLRELRVSAQPLDAMDLDEAAITAVEDEERRLADDGSLQAGERVWANERRFAVEDVDPHWSETTTVEVSDAIAGAAGDGVHVIGLECRSSICRVELDYTEPHARAEVELAFGRLSLDTTGGTLLDDENEPDITTYTYYMMRPGASPL